MRVRKCSREGKSTSGSAAQRTRSVAPRQGRGRGRGEFHSVNRQLEFPRLHSVARRLNGFMRVGGHDGGGISDDTKAARGRSEMREILIKRGRTGGRRGFVIDLANSIPLCPCSSIASFDPPSTPREFYLHATGNWRVYTFHTSRLTVFYLRVSFQVHLDDFYQFYKFQNLQFTNY